MRVRAWRRLTLVACFMGLLALGAACDSGASEVVVRPADNGFTIVGTIGDKSDFHLLNDSDNKVSAQVIALNGHSMTQLQDALANGGLPDWATSVGTIEAEAGKVAEATLDTDDGDYAIVDTTGDQPLVAALSRTEEEEGPATAVEGGAGGGAAEAATVPPLPAAGPVGPATGTVAVSLKEFSVTPNPTSTASGQVTFNLKNDGAVLHELLIVRTAADPAGLPQSGGRVDEENPGLEIAGKILNVAAGASGSTTAGLPAGNYVLICNIPGHYQAGMHTAFTVQ
jgi:uncharacterized cupredoxin-like copper-binding protein